jgi:nucleoid-associated protein YgaU
MTKGKHHRAASDTRIAVRFLLGAAACGGIAAAGIATLPAPQPPLSYTGNLAELHPGAPLPAPHAATAAPARRPGVYVTVTGDTLWSVAARDCGSGADWPHLYGANQGVLAGSSVLRPGTRLRVAC